MKRPDEERSRPGGHADDRRRQFEESRGLSERGALQLDEEATGEEPDTPGPQKEEEPPRGGSESGAR